MIDQRRAPAQPAAADLPIQVTQCDTLNALHHLETEWNRLVERSGNGTIFQTFEWQASWWRACGDDAKLLILLAQKDGTLVGIAPLMLSVKRVLGRTRRVVEFIGGADCDYCDVIVEPPSYQVVDAFLQWLITNSRLWDLLQLANIKEDSPLREVIPAWFGQRGYRLDIQGVIECPTRRFGDPAGDWQLVKKKSLRRHYNYFQRHGGLEFKQYSNAGEIDGHLDRFFQQHIRRWHLAGISSQFLDARQRAFYHELVRTVAPTGWLRFAILTYDAAPIAFHLGFEYNNRIFWIKPTFDVDYQEHSPGEVLLKFMLEDAMARGVAEFDFTVGEEAYKYRFANHIRVNYAARVYRRALAYHLDTLALGVRELARRSPALERFGRRLLGSKRFPSHSARLGTDDRIGEIKR